MSINVHSASPAAAMHLWLHEADGDGWLARVDSPGKMLDSFGPGWNEVVVSIADFSFQPRGPGNRQMVSANEMQIGCNLATWTSRWIGYAS